MPFDGEDGCNGRAPKRQRTEPLKPNHIVLMTIRNALYPIDVEVIHKISSPLGRVQRIVIFRKNGVQALVEFENVEQATRARQELDGADIYQGCCTLKLEFAKPAKLNVYKNDKDTWDYTGCLDTKEKDSGRHKAALLGPPPMASPNSAPYVTSPGAGGLMGVAGAGGYGSGGYDDGSFGRNGRAALAAPGGMAQQQGQQSQSPVGRNGAAAAYGVACPGVPDGAAFDYHHGGAYGAQSGAAGMPGMGAMAKGGAYGDRRGDMGVYDRRGGADDYSAGGRGMAGQANFNSLPPPMHSTGCVLMVYGLAPRINASHLFNLFCLYGNVIRVKFLRSKPGCAMVQMGDGASVERAVQNIHSAVLFDQTLQVNYSKQAFLHEEVKAYDLPDGSPSFREFSKSRNNRFSNSELAAKNRIRPPSNTLHFFNAPSDVTDERLRDVFTKEDLTPPKKITMFENKNLKSQTGMLEFETVQQASEALVICNHAPIQSPASPFPFLLKLCFTSGSYPKHLTGDQQQQQQQQAATAGQPIQNKVDMGVKYDMEC